MTDRNNKEEERQSTPQKDVEKTPAGDPQQRMEGPVSSTVHNTGKVFDTKETKEEATRKRDEHM